MTVFISCVKKKKPYTTTAENLYDSDFFRSQLSYAKSLNPIKIYILSAKYGVLELNDIVSPYEKTLKTMKVQECYEWGAKVTRQLIDKNFDFDSKVVFLCGAKYRKPIIHLFTNYETPLEGMGIGKQLQWLKNNT